jgi:hypothetical protein
MTSCASDNRANARKFVSPTSGNSCAASAHVIEKLDYANSSAPACVNVK